VTVPLLAKIPSPETEAAWGRRVPAYLGNLWTGPVRSAPESGHRRRTTACPLWMAPALQGENWYVGFGRVQSSVRPVDAVGWGLLAL